MRIILFTLISVVAGVSILLMFAVFGITSTMSSSWHGQCDSIVGPDPSVIETTTPVNSNNTANGTAADVMNPSDIPTTNPYAAMTTDPSNSAWGNSCIKAMKTAPLQLPPLQTFNTSAAAACARALALGQLGARAIDGAGTLSGATAGGFGPPELARYITFVSSKASGSGRCDQHTDASTSTAGMGTTASTWCGRTYDTGGSSMVLLPDSVAEQGLCGQRVDPSAVSPGDLVFWGYRNTSPTRVGVAVGNKQMVTCEPATGSVALEPIPPLPDVRIKRVLSETME